MEFTRCHANTDTTMIHAGTWDIFYSDYAKAAILRYLDVLEYPSNVYDKKWDSALDWDDPEFKLQRLI